MSQIKHIIFDLGGVILNIDYQRTEQAFKNLGILHFADLYNQFHASRLFEDFETGKIAPETFLAELKKEAPQGVTDKQLIEAWNAMLLDFPLSRLQLLQQLRNQYNLYLLSNTNALHLEAFHKLLLETRGLPSLGVLFEKTYYSHLIGQRKPSREVYEWVLAQNRLSPEETLFIDDSLHNVEGARSAKLQTIHLQPPLTIHDIFKPAPI